MVRLGGPDEKVEFELGESFFAAREYSEWNGGEITASVSTSKESGVITLSFELKGSLLIMCDRCLEYYSQEVDARDALYVKFGEEHTEIDENVVVVTRDEHQIDVAPYLEEFLILALPLKKVHADNEDGSYGCNIEMIEKLEKHLVKEVEKASDPRWDELKKLKDKN